MLFKDSAMDVLVTGGAGYIGSHTLIQLIEDGYKPVVFDNLVNSSRKALERVEQITHQTIEFVEGDIRDLGKKVWDRFTAMI